MDGLHALVMDSGAKEGSRSEVDMSGAYCERRREYDGLVCMPNRMVASMVKWFSEGYVLSFGLIESGGVRR